MTRYAYYVYLPDPRQRYAFDDVGTKALRSLSLHCPGTEVILLCWEPPPSALLAASKASRATTIIWGWDRKLLMAEKMTQLAEFPWKKGDEVFVIDLDVLVQDNLFAAFHQYPDADVFVTTRFYEYEHPINAGVWGFRINARSLTFLHHYADQAFDPTWPPFRSYQEKFGHLEDRGWWCDQDYLCALWREVKANRPTPGGVRVVDLGPKYNWCPSERDLKQDAENILGKVGDKEYKALHFKGKLKWIMPDPK